jgi:hypothetical protein
VTFGAVPLRVPCVGGVVTANVRLAGAVSASLPVSVMGLAVFRLVATPCGFAVGAVFTARTVILTVAAVDVSGAEQSGPGAPQLSGLPRSVTLNWKLSGPA